MESFTTFVPPPRVLVGPVRFEELCPTGYGQLVDAGLEVILNPGTTPLTSQQIANLGGEAEAAIMGMELWTPEVIDSCPRLKILSKLGVGLDTVDLGHARSRGIDVTNAPGGNANAVAEMAVGLILAALRHIPLMDRSLRAGTWDRFTGSELAGKTVGFVGFGVIGRTLARRLSGFDVRCVFTDPGLDSSLADPPAEICSLDQLLGVSDVVTIHAPDVEATHHMVDSTFLSKMKTGAVLVNTARGGLVREADLVTALASGRLRAAALDVWEHEPTDESNPLLDMDNVVATPHGAADSYEAYERVGAVVATAIVERLRDGHPLNIQN